MLHCGFVLSKIQKRGGLPCGVDKWKIGTAAGGLNDVDLYKFQSMKTVLTLILALAGYFFSSAQPSERVVRVLPFPVAIDAVLKDFPSNLQHITGELLLAQGEIDSYVSIVELEGAQHCVITRYHSTRDTTASWQANMFSSDDFVKASRQYHDLFRKLESCSVQLEDSTVVFFTGTWAPAKEEVPFTASTFTLRTGDWRYKEVRVELELVYLMADWAVRINIISKKADDEVGGVAGGQ
jgi:hypothetical protein